MSTTWAGYSPHLCRFVYSKTVKNAHKESRATKVEALSWFHKSRMFDTINPNKSYAQAVKNISTVPHNRKIYSPGSSVTKTCTKFSYGRIHNDNAKSTDKESHDLSTVAGVPVKYGKCLSTKHSVPCAPTMTKLRNRFQCLQDYVEVNDVIHSDILTNSIENHKDDSIHVINMHEHIDNTKQYSEECKTPNIALEGNKNETGLFDVVSYGMEEPGNDITLTEKQEVGVCVAFDGICNEQSHEVDGGTYHGPRLAPTQNYFLDGNKNETGSFDGDTWDISTKNTSQIMPQICITAGVSNQVSTDDSQPVLDGNCCLNSSATLQCGKDNVEGHVKNKYYNFINHTEHQFGFCPLTPCTLYKGSPVHWDCIPNDLQAHEIIKNTGKPNFMAARIPVHSQLNIDRWRAYLANYWDKQLLDLLEYGFPLDASRENEFISTVINHASALQNLHHVQSYIDEELKFKAILGPFPQKPMALHVSPLMVRDKQDSCSKRTIMDLSWPKGASVNTAVLKDVYLGTQYFLNYPSIDSITDALVKLGPAALIYKIDISRAFRQIKIDPRDIDLLGIKFRNQYFIDRSVPFGYRNGSQIFQRCSDAIRFTMQQHGFPHLFNYIDDLIYTGLPSNIHNSFQFLLKLLQELGLEISQKKLVAPHTTVVCLGIQIDTVSRTLSIPQKKLEDIVALCKSWVTKTYCSKRALQSLLGSLLYITKCVKPARIFLNRMLALLRDNYQVEKILLTQLFFQDLAWFNTFLSAFNGVTYYDKKLASAQVHLDACLTGLGGHFDSMVYALEIPIGYNNYDICQLEMLNIVVALKIWANHWRNKKIHIYCDNIAVVQVMNTGRTRDSILATCARNVWLIAAMYNIEINFSHISGKSNIIVDLLSRWYMVLHPEQKLTKLLPNYKWVDSHIDLTVLNHTI